MQAPQPDAILEEELKKAKDPDSLVNTMRERFPSAERADSLIKNLKKEYPALQDINGNMKLGTLRDRLGVDSLDQALKKLRQK